MRFKIEFKNSGIKRLPFGYQYYLSSAVYNILALVDPDYAEWLHSNGIKVGNRRYKPFVFSWLYASQKKVDKNGLILSGPINWFISSPCSDFCNTFFRGITKSGKLRVGAETFYLKEMDINTVFPNKIFKTLSPVVVSLSSPDGHTKYLSPADPEYLKALKKNAILRRLLSEGRSVDDLNNLSNSFTLEIFDVHKKAVNYNGITIIAYNYSFKMSGDDAMIKFILEAGLGEKNSMGFGFVG